MKRFIIILFFISNSALVFSQKMRSGIEYSFDTQKIALAKTFTWYGWDYSHLIINDPKVNAQEVKTKWVPYWYMSVNKAGFGSKKIQKIFKDKEFVDDPRTIQSLVATVPDSKFIDIYRSPVEIDSIKQIVKNYSVKGDGIGVVSIVSEMRKADITVMVFTVIFDINTKEVLYVIKARGKAGDKGGFGRFYNKGIVLAMKVFAKSFKI